MKKLLAYLILIAIVAYTVTTIGEDVGTNIQEAHNERTELLNSI